EVADYFLRGPVLLVRAATERALGAVRDGRVQLVAGAAQTLQPLRAWHLGDLFPVQHGLLSPSRDGLMAVDGPTIGPRERSHPTRGSASAPRAVGPRTRIHDAVTGVSGRGARRARSPAGGRLARPGERRSGRGDRRLVR